MDYINITISLDGTDYKAKVSKMSSFRDMGVDQNYGPLFGPLDYKEYGIIQTPKGPTILINPQISPQPSSSSIGSCVATSATWRIRVLSK